MSSKYQLKRVQLYDDILQQQHSYKIICQNKNGSCPLIAICNVLILRGEVDFPESWSEVDSDYLISVIGELLLNKITPVPVDAKEKQIELDGKDSEQLSNEPSCMDKGKAKLDPDAPAATVLTDNQKNIDDLLPVIPRLCTGLDVNVRFDSVFSFELQPELLIFDLFNIRLCHAWLPPGNELEIKNMSYNGLTDAIIKGQDAAHHIPDSEQQAQYELGLRCSEFMQNSASQITIEGLFALNEQLQPAAIVVLFRNNHFSVLHKHEGQLLVLVTDQGYSEHENVVWETLNNISGNSCFLDGHLKPVSLSSSRASPPAALPNREPANMLADNDYALALQLQDQLNIEADQENQSQEEGKGEPDFIDKVADKCSIQ